MAIWLIAIGAVVFALGLIALLLSEGLAGRLATSRNRPDLTPVAHGGTSHDRMGALIESQTSARSQRRALVRTIRRFAMAMTVVAMLPIAAGLIMRLSQ
ncbi:MAG: hypothetical protein CL878_13285 [Dehalococcoidia bacterium]|nr:hypothetical protein [Dehalococcoidia bacterium]